MQWGWNSFTKYLGQGNHITGIVSAQLSKTQGISNCAYDVKTSQFVFVFVITQSFNQNIQSMFQREGYHSKLFHGLVHLGQSLPLAHLNIFC